LFTQIAYREVISVTLAVFVILQINSAYPEALALQMVYQMSADEPASATY
jgi:hypothetical protein